MRTVIKTRTFLSVHYGLKVNQMSLSSHIAVLQEVACNVNSMVAISLSKTDVPSLYAFILLIILLKTYSEISLSEAGALKIVLLKDFLANCRNDQLIYK